MKSKETTSFPARVSYNLAGQPPPGYRKLQSLLMILTMRLPLICTGETHFEALVIASDSEEEHPAPDGTTRQYLADFGDFAVFLVNRDLDVRTTSTKILFPFQNNTSQHTQKVRPSKKSMTGSAEEEAVRIYR